MLPLSYYLNEDVLYLAKDLLGKKIYTQIDNEIVAGIIVETEAYKAPEDKASHAFGNKRTKRTSVMFEEGGVSYVYLCYGIHHMLNFVTGPKDTAHAILIRAIEPIENIDVMKQRRKKSSLVDLGSGPGKCAMALGLNLENNNTPLYKNETIWVEDNPSLKFDIISSPRVGIGYAEESAHLPWRFRIRDSIYTSKPHIVTYP